MSKEKRKGELMLNPLALVTAAVNYAASVLPHLPDEQLEPGEVTIANKKVPVSAFWLQFGKQKRFKIRGGEVSVTVPPVMLIELTFQSVLKASKAKGLGAFMETLNLLGFSENDLESAGRLDDLYSAFRNTDEKMRAKVIGLLRLQFAFEIVRYTILGETIKLYDGHADFLGADKAAFQAASRAVDLPADRARCVRMRERFPYFVRLWAPFFRIYTGLGPPHKFDPQQPIAELIPEELRSWIELTN